MPRLVEGSEVSARLSPDVAPGLGPRRARNIPIAGGGGDNAASAIGVGATAPGAGFVSLGTSGVIFSVTDRFVSLPERTLHAFCHALPASLARHGGDAVGRLLALLDRRRPRPRARHRRTDRRRGGLRPIEERGRVRADLPALSQRRAHAAQRRRGDRHVRGPDGPSTARMRSSSRSWRASLSRSPTASTCWTRPARGRSGRCWSAAARGRNSGAQMIADVTGLTIDLAPGAEAGAALGAARLGMLAAGAGSVEAVCTRPPVQREFKPDPDARGDACAAPQALSRALSGREGDAG